jgi:hypothetical protein
MRQYYVKSAFRFCGQCVAPETQPLWTPPNEEVAAKLVTSGCISPVGDTPKDERKVKRLLAPTEEMATAETEAREALGIALVNMGVAVGFAFPADEDRDDGRPKIGELVGNIVASMKGERPTSAAKAPKGSSGKKAKQATQQPPLPPRPRPNPPPPPPPPRK